MAYPYNSYQNMYQQGYYPMYQQPQYQQPVMQQPQQTAQTYTPAVNTSGIIWISGMSEASMFPVGPNNAVALWDRNGKSIYLKQADATGKPTMTVYDLVERDNSVSDSANEQDAKQPTYATKDELGAVVGVVKGFDEMLASIKSDVDAMKGDMYGIAGKKKAKKQAEVTEDE